MTKRQENNIANMLDDLEASAYGYSINGQVIGMDCSDFEQLMFDASDIIRRSIANWNKISSLPKMRKQKNENKWYSTDQVFMTDGKLIYYGWIVKHIKNEKERITGVAHCLTEDVIPLKKIIPTHWMPLPELPKEIQNEKRN